MRTYNLLIWMSWPEEISFYLIPEDIARPHRDKLEMAHNHYINASDLNDGLNFLNAVLDDYTSENYNTEERFIEAHGNFAKYKGTWAPFKMAAEQPITPDGLITKVYCSGFVM